MIRFLVMVTFGVPATIWYATRIAWAVYRKADNAACVCAEVPRTWARLLLPIPGVRVEVGAAAYIRPAAPPVPPPAKGVERSHRPP